METDGIPSTRESDAQPSKERLSVLGQLAARREEVKEAATLDLPVPRWQDPAIFVRYVPVDHAIIRRATTAADKVEGRKKAQAELDANCDVLVAGCIGVYAVIDGERYSLRLNDSNGELTRFDEDLAANLGLDPDRSSARQVVKQLFIADGDIVAQAGKVATFSGYKDQEGEEAVLGE